MPSPVRSRLCPAARYFLKEVDSDTGGSPEFCFDDGVWCGGRPYLAFECFAYKSVHFGSPLLFWFPLPTSPIFYVTGILQCHSNFPTWRERRRGLLDLGQAVEVVKFKENARA